MELPRDDEQGDQVDARAGIEDPGRVCRVRTRPQRPDPEVPERARRRTFTAKYKLEILAAYDAAADGEKGALLRREGLYSSHIVEWRRARDAGALAGLARAAWPSAARPAGRADRPPAAGEAATGAGAGQGPLRGGCAGKTARALGDALRERGHRAEVDAVTDDGDRRAGARGSACGRPARPSGWRRPATTGGTAHSPPPPRPAPIPHRDRPQPRALSHGRAAGDPRRAAQRPVRRPGAGRGVGDAARRGRLPGLDVHVLPAAAPGRRDPGTAPRRPPTRPP